MKKLYFVVAVSILGVQVGCQKEEPKAPQIVYPPDSAEFDKLPVTLIWNSSPDADRYRLKLQVSLGTHSDTVLLADQSLDTSFLITDEMFHCPYVTSFVWSVAGKSDSLERWSASRIFTIDRGITGPRLLSPLDGAVFDTLPPTFIWSSDISANGFLVNIMNLADSVITFNPCEDTVYEMPHDSFKILGNGSYLWWITTTINGWILSSEMRTMIIQKPDL